LEEIRGKHEAVEGIEEKNNTQDKVLAL